MRTLPALTLLALAAGVAAAQSVEPLPKIMHGTWTAVVPNVRTFTDTFSVTLDGPPQGGALAGRLTLRGGVCGAQNEPLTGTWDGTELRLESMVRPNVNAQRPNGQCGNGRVTFVPER